MKLMKNKQPQSLLTTHHQSTQTEDDLQSTKFEDISEANPAVANNQHLPTKINEICRQLEEKYGSNIKKIALDLFALDVKENDKEYLSDGTYNISFHNRQTYVDDKADLLEELNEKKLNRPTLYALLQIYSNKSRYTNEIAYKAQALADKLEQRYPELLELKESLMGASLSLMNETGHQHIKRQIKSAYHQRATETNVKQDIIDIFSQDLKTGDKPVHSDGSANPSFEKRKKYIRDKENLLKALQGDHLDRNGLYKLMVSVANPQVYTNELVYKATFFKDKLEAMLPQLSTNKDALEQEALSEGDNQRALLHNPMYN